MTYRLVLAIVRRQWRALVASVGGTLFFGFAMYLLLPRVYESGFILRVPPPVVPPEVAILKQYVKLTEVATGDNMSQVLQVLQSRDVLKNALIGVGVVKQTGMEDAVAMSFVDQMGRDLIITSLPGTGPGAAGTIQARIRGVNPEATQRLAESYLSAFRASEGNQRISTLQDAAKSLGEAQKKSKDEVSPKDAAVSNLKDLKTREEEFIKKEQEIAKNRESLESDLQTWRRARSELLIRYTESWWEVRDLQQRIDLGDAVLKAWPVPETAELPTAAWKTVVIKDAELRAERSALLEQFDQQFLTHLRKYRNTDPSRLDRELQIAKDAEWQLAQELSRLETSIKASAAPYSVVERPFRPTDPVSPRPGQWLPLIFAASVLSGALVLYMAYASDSTLDSAEAVQHYAGRNVLGVLWFIPPGDGKVGAAAAALAYRKEETLPQAEPFRLLKTNIAYTIPDIPNPMFLVTSSDPEEGKSTVSSNLACAFAEEGRRTLLLGCNLRRPTDSLRFNVAVSPGLTDYLKSGGDWRQLRKETHVPNLTVITSGNPAVNAAVLLAKRSFQQLLEEAHKEYDVVIIDSPPVLAVTDALLISPHTDGVLLVYAANQTRKELLRRAIELLENSAPGAGQRPIQQHVLGIALNVRFPFASRPAYGYEYHRKVVRT
ncbi:MAG: polysaccharide biosynthesis tyrosine autokinase [Planctomycetes bacterium]|nr:polysaccharide biosynthesis tyrosine autokinase [Planctomycetota bacterium]